MAIGRSGQVGTRVVLHVAPDRNLEPDPVHIQRHLPGESRARETPRKPKRVSYTPVHVRDQLRNMTLRMNKT